MKILRNETNGDIVKEWMESGRGRRLVTTGDELEGVETDGGQVMGLYAREGTSLHSRHIRTRSHAILREGTE